MWSEFESGLFLDIDTSTRSVWGEIECPQFESIDGQSVCEIGPSYYYFENCPEL